MTNAHYPPRVYALVAILGCCTLLYVVSRLEKARAYQDPYPFRTQYNRLREVKSQLSGQRRIGYLSNLGPGERGGSRLYFPTQYVMAPTLLVPLEDKPDVEWVLGNFTRQEDFRAAGLPFGLEVVKEYPMGVVLYRKTRKASGSYAAEAPASSATPIPQSAVKP